jgi:y4mF family transcriptional regulator
MWAQSAAEVGRIIVAARKHRGLTQAALAQAVGATQAWISAVEQGKDTAQIGKILRVLSYLGVRLQAGTVPWVGGQSSLSKRTNVSLSDVIAAHTDPRPRKAIR